MRQHRRWCILLSIPPTGRKVPTARTTCKHEKNQNRLWHFQKNPLLGSKSKDKEINDLKNTKPDIVFVAQQQNDKSIYMSVFPPVLCICKIDYSWGLF